MGYYSTFEVDTLNGDLTDIMLNRLTHISGYEFDKDSVSSCYIHDAKWYSFDEHMINLSKEFPTTLFSINRVGEDSERSIYYYYNGVEQDAKCRMEHDAPDPVFLGMSNGLETMKTKKLI